MSFQKVYGDSTTNYNPSHETGYTRTPRVDVYESEAMYYLRLSIPGVKSENLVIRFVNETDLEIKGHVKPSHPQHIENLVTKEIYEGPFYRLIRFPTELLNETIQFDYSCGILNIYIEKNVNKDEN